MLIILLPIIGIALGISNKFRPTKSKEIALRVTIIMMCFVAGFIIGSG